MCLHIFSVLIFTTGCNLTFLLVCCQVLHDAVLFGVIPIVYEFEGTSLEFLLHEIDTCLCGRTARYCGHFYLI